MAAKFRNSDARIDGDVKRPVRRDGVGINRDTEVAQDQVKYDFEVLERGMSFKTKLQVENAEDSDFALLYILLQEWKQGVEFGGKRSRGLGQVVLESYSVQYFDARVGRDLAGFLREGLHNMPIDEFEVLQLRPAFDSFTKERV
jgi:CRISPR/Cas system CSM-associated protein Csm3 (group 7 of RAMP superfamily)